MAWSLLVNHQRAVCWGADNLTVEVTPHTAESIFGRTRLESALFWAAANFSRVESLIRLAISSCVRPAFSLEFFSEHPYPSDVVLNSHFVEQLGKLAPVVDGVDDVLSEDVR